MASLNRITIVGNLTKDPTGNTTSGGTAVANFSVATNERVKKNGEWVDHVEYFDVVFFGKLAEVATTYLLKGNQVLVEGPIRKEKYTKDGVEKLSVKIIGDKLVMLGSKDGGKPRSGGDGSRTYEAPMFNDDSEIPFMCAPGINDPY